MRVSTAPGEGHAASLPVVQVDAQDVFRLFDGLSFVDFHEWGEGGADLLYTVQTFTITKVVDIAVADNFICQRISRPHQRPHPWPKYRCGQQFGVGEVGRQGANERRTLSSRSAMVSRKISDISRNNVACFCSPFTHSQCG
jgi:hypothetical protein